MSKKIRVETFDGKTRTISLTDAKKEFGEDELFEYVLGYSSTAIFFLVVDGVDLHPVTKDVFFN